MRESLRPLSVEGHGYFVRRGHGLMKVYLTGRATFPLEAHVPKTIGTATVIRVAAKQDALSHQQGWSRGEGEPIEDLMLELFGISRALWAQMVASECRAHREPGTECWCQLRAERLAAAATPT